VEEEKRKAGEKSKKKEKSKQKREGKDGLAYRKNRKLPLDVIEKINYLQPEVRIMLIDSVRDIYNTCPIAM